MHRPTSTCPPASRTRGAVRLGCDIDGFDLLITRTEDPLQNVALARNNYRTLQAWRLTDANDNRSAVRFDALGLVVASALMGKRGQNEGDTLDETTAESALGDLPTTRLEYELFNWRDRQLPVSAHTLARTRHYADDPAARWQESYSYSDGFGRQVQQKVQAEPGAVEPGGATVNPRWVGSGWTIYNNKGKPVRQYEHFFSRTAAFEFAAQVGVSATLLYDPLTRVVGTLHPNHTFEKVVFDPWRQETWDANDTVLVADPAADADVGAYVGRLVTAEYMPTWHAQRQNGRLGSAEQDAAAKAAGSATSTVAHLDSLGRPFLTVADNGPDPAGNPRQYETRVVLDIQGRHRAVIDALGRTVMTYHHDLLGRQLHQDSVDAGERWLLPACRQQAGPHVAHPTLAYPTLTTCRMQNQRS